MLYNIDLKKIVAYSKRDNLQTMKKEVLENNKDKHLILDLQHSIDDKTLL